MTTPDTPTAPASGEQPVVLDPESQPSPTAPGAAEAPGTGGSRLSGGAGLAESAGPTRASPGSRSSGFAATSRRAATRALRRPPTSRSRCSPRRSSSSRSSTWPEATRTRSRDRLITHMRLDGKTASLVRDLFGTTSNNVLAASITIVIGFLIWGLSIGQLYQDVYARAWRIHVGAAADQAAVHDLLLRLQRVFALCCSARRRSSAPRLVALRFRSGSPARCSSGSGPHASCSIARSRFVPSCPGRSSRRSSLGGTIATSPLWIGPTLNQNGKAFGSFGVVIGLFAYILIVDHDLDGLCRLRSRLGRMAAGARTTGKRQEAEEADVSSNPAVVSGTAGCAE